MKYNGETGKDKLKKLSNQLEIQCDIVVQHIVQMIEEDIQEEDVRALALATISAKLLKYADESTGRVVIVEE